MRRWRTKFRQNTQGRFHLWFRLILYIAVLAVILFYMGTIGDMSASCFAQITQ